MRRVCVQFQPDRVPADEALVRQALRDAIPDISDRMLSERLRILEEEGLIVRHVLPDPPIKVEYELTQMGRELNKSLEAVGSWAEKWLPSSAPDGASEGKPEKSSNKKTATRA